MSSYKQRMAAESASHLWQGFLNGAGFVVAMIMVPFLIAHILLIVVVGAVVAIGQMFGITKHERPAIPQWAEWKARWTAGRE